MSHPTIAQKAPYKMTVEAGEEVVKKVVGGQR